MWYLKSLLSRLAISKYSWVNWNERAPQDGVGLDVLVGREALEVQLDEVGVHVAQ